MGTHQPQSHIISNLCWMGWDGQEIDKNRRGGEEDEHPASIRHVQFQARLCSHSALAFESNSPHQRGGAYYTLRCTTDGLHCLTQKRLHR
mmetsp:Transcript_13400/g.35157  ORF Transcript_13400/g.35157 Transcript_13400/m.35157 type:complete len:90 (+) Transcript_13400:317-586(+)